MSCPAFLSWLFCHNYPIPAVIFKLSCPRPPVTVVLALLPVPPFCPWRHVMAVLSSRVWLYYSDHPLQMLSSSYPVPAVMFQLSSTTLVPSSFVSAVLFWLSCSDCLVLSILSRLSCPGCPFLAVLSQRSSLMSCSWLSPRGWKKWRINKKWEKNSLPETWI